MTVPLEPRPPGDPAAMLAFADALSRRADDVARRADALRSRARMTTFQGPAGRRFTGSVEEQTRSLLSVGGDLRELANRCRREAATVEASIRSWEIYRDRVLQQRLEQANDPGEVSP